MAAGSVMLSLPQMVDLALCAPENGAVNFNLLHATLHVLLQQLELNSCNVEFRGKEGDKIQGIIELTKKSPPITLTEYIVTPTKDAGKILKRRGGPKTGSPEAIDIDKIEDQDLQTVVVVEPITDASSYVPVVISKDYLQNLQSEIDGLKRTVKELTELPANASLIEAARSAGLDKATPVLDMFQITNLSKRVDAAEVGINKLASIIEDLARQGPGDALDFTTPDVPGVSSSTHSKSSALGKGKTPSVLEAIRNIEERITNVENRLATGTNLASLNAAHSTTAPSPTASHADDGKKSEISSQLSSKIDVTPDLSKLSPNEFAKNVEDEIQKIKQHLKLLYDKLEQQQQHHKARRASEGEAFPEGDASPQERLTELEDKFVEYSQQITSLDASFNAELASMHDQFTGLEKEMGMVLERINLGLPAGDSNVGTESISELYDKIMALQSDIDTLGDTATKLVEDMEEKQKWMDALLEQIEILKTIKADKEDLEDALADKADACAINRKVSHDQFDTACDELSRGIEEALGKLTQQENMWQQALDEIQKEIDSKLDKMELGPLRDFVNNKLKMLQQRLKALTALKNEAEAAGTKKFLRDVNCISCDKNVVMRKEMDPSLVPPAYSLPPTKSMGPYLAYELDALRKQQKNLATSRNLHHFESAVHSKSPRGEDHVCNRYCGGSHTVTTPQQRVTRLGHFLNQWGLEAPEPTDSGRKEEVSIKGEAMPSKPSKAMTSREQIEKEGTAGPKRASSAQTHPKRMSSDKKVLKSSQQKISSPTASGERVNKRPQVSLEAVDKKSGAAEQAKGNKENVEKKRSAPPATATQKAPPTSAKSPESTPAINEKAEVGIPEETPSEVAEDHAPEVTLDLES